MSKLKTALAIGACLLAVGTTTALVGNVYKEEIKDWWTETFEKDDANQEYNYLDQYVETGEIEDLVLTAEKIKDNAFDIEENPMILKGKLSLLNCKEIGYLSFYFQSGLEELYAPSIERIEQQAFESCCLKKIDLGENISFIGEGAFMDSEAATLIIRNKEVPTFGELSALQIDMTIYVPDESLELYKTDEVLLEIFQDFNINDKIKPLSKYVE